MLFGDKRNQRLLATAEQLFGEAFTCAIAWDQATDALAREHGVDWPWWNAWNDFIFCTGCTGMAMTHAMRGRDGVSVERSIGRERLFGAVYAGARSMALKQKHPSRASDASGLPALPQFDEGMLRAPHLGHVLNDYFTFCGVTLLERPNEQDFILRSGMWVWHNVKDSLQGNEPQAFQDRFVINAGSIIHGGFSGYWDAAWNG